jgi:UDP-3-O-[3-hydroxymyristoyl] glucosamine N-acyltransferase
MANIFIHPSAEVQSNNIGKGTVIWQYAIVLKNAKVGKNCNINAHTFIENDVVIGNNVTVKCGVFLWDGLRVEDNVFIGPNATFTNDRYPKSKTPPDTFDKTILKKGCS